MTETEIWRLHETDRIGRVPFNFLSEVAMKTVMLGLVMALGVCAARAQVRMPQEDFLTARDRTEWQAGALYEGRFEDGTPLRMELFYPIPPGLPQHVSGGAYPKAWDPRNDQGQPTMLLPDPDADGDGGTMRLRVLDEQRELTGEMVAVTLAADRASARGVWNAPGKPARSFTLQRSLPYTGIVVTRPVSPGMADHPYYREHGFLFSAIFPVLSDPTADAWIREQAGVCHDTGECDDEVRIMWRSPSLVSLEALAWGDSGGAHGVGYSVTRQYRIQNGTMTPLGLDDFVDPSPACRDAMAAAIVAKLKAKGMAWADKVDGHRTGKLTPTAAGIAFHFDSYEAGPYAQGAPTVFVPKAEMGGCVRYLPAD
jgi:hypothetical protein